MAVDQRHVQNQFDYFCNQIQDKCDKIMFIISEQHTLESINIFIIIPKSKIHACKSYNLESDTDSCRHV